MHMYICAHALPYMYSHMCKQNVNTSHTYICKKMNSAVCSAAVVKEVLFPWVKSFLKSDASLTSEVFVLNKCSIEEKRY